MPSAAEHIKVAGADGNGHEAKSRRQHLQKRKLHFQRVLEAMRLLVFRQQRHALLQFGGEFFVDGGVAQRGMPCAFAHDGQRLAHAGVIGAEDYHALRQIDPAIDRTGDMARIHVAGVRHDAAQRANFSLDRSIGRRGGIALDFGAEALGVRRIKSPGNGRRTNCGCHDICSRKLYEASLRL